MLQIDGIIFSLQRSGGISVYFRELISHLSGQGTAFAVTAEEPVRQEIGAMRGATGYSHPVTRRARVGERFRSCRTLAGASLFHSSYYRIPDRALPSVVTVHDFVYERFMSVPSRYIHSSQKFKAVSQADAIICVSQSTLDDLFYFYGEPKVPCVVIHNGVGLEFFFEEPEYSQDRHVLFVGGRAGYKNFESLAYAMRGLCGFELVCVGGGPITSSERHMLRDVPFKHYEHVSNQDLRRLYCNAVCLVYPSRYEGFGIPIIEAFNCGCPVVVFPCKSSLEVGGSAVLTASSSDEIVDAVKYLADENARRLWRKRGFDQGQNFSWTKSHSLTCSIYESFGSFCR